MLRLSSCLCIARRVEFVLHFELLHSPTSDSNRIFLVVEGMMQNLAYVTLSSIEAAA